jgi:hypothetical protein
MSDHQTTRLKAIAQQQEPVLVLRVVGIVYQTGVLVKEDGLCFLERDPMLYEVGPGLTPIPGKYELPTALF